MKIISVQNKGKSVYIRIIPSRLFTGSNPVNCFYVQNKKNVEYIKIFFKIYLEWEICTQGTNFFF